LEICSSFDDNKKKQQQGLTIFELFRIFPIIIFNEAMLGGTCCDGNEFGFVLRRIVIEKIAPPNKF
jgi:hypothetical protein